MKFYTGIGSRQTPNDVLDLMARLARKLATQEYTLRSGHAIGADWGFEQGAASNAHIYLPWAGFGQKPYGSDPGRPILGTPFVPTNYQQNYATLIGLGIRNSNGTSEAIRKLHARNVCQVLGHADYPTASRFVVCWCPLDEHGQPQGGTAPAIKLAQHHNIQVFNLIHDAVKERIEARIGGEQ